MKRNLHDLNLFAPFILLGQLRWIMSKNLPYYHESVTESSTVTPITALDPFFLLQFFYLGLDSNMKYFELLKLSRVSLRVSQKNSFFHVLTIILCSVGYSDSTDNLKVMGWISIRVQELSKLTLRHRIILKKLIFSQEVRIEPTHSRCRGFYAD